MLLSDISVLLLATGDHFLYLVFIGFWFSLYFQILLETYNQQYIPDNRQNYRKKNDNLLHQKYVAQKNYDISGIL